MKPIEALAFVVTLVVMTLFGVWVGASLGVIGCANAGDQGYSHRVFKEGYRAYCEIREVKQ